MKLVLSPDPILKQTAVDWSFETDADPEKLEKEMIELMLSFKGIGLAANQIGLLKRVLAIKLQKHQDIVEPFAMFNPSIVNTSEQQQDGQEGCLSFPDLWLDVKRPQSVDVEYFDKQGKQCIITLTGIDARCFLHELDHLNGIVFTEKVSQLKLILARKKQRKTYGRTK